MYLYAKGSIAHDVLLNLAFFAFVMAPQPGRFPQRRSFDAARQVLNAALAACLLWHDSWLPAPAQAWAQLGQQGMPSAPYIVSFLLGYFNGALLAVIVGILMVTFVLRRWSAAMGALVAVLLVAAPWAVAWTAEPAKPAARRAAAPKATEPAAFLEEFYARESERVVLFKKPKGPAFDIVVVHVCSMAWADLKATGLDQHAFFKQFDYVLSDFNAVSSYSNPAVMRLLRSNCGQTSHSDLYDPTPPTCLLFESLHAAGYQTWVAMSHDGHYGDYVQDIRKNGLDRATFVMPDKKVPPEAVFFDDSKTYSDLQMFKRWLDARGAAATAGPAALYYNSVNLHAGSHWVDEKKWWLREKNEQYVDVASILLRDLNQAVELLAASKRNTVLLFVPEHGRALTSTPMQGQDLRDVPLPQITRVPVGIRLFGPGFGSGQRAAVSKPTSYLALSWLLSKFVEKSPFGASPEAVDEIVRKMPETGFVSEHSGSVIVDTGDGYFLGQKEKPWIRLSPAQLGEE